MVLALHTVSGQVADVPPKMLEHPHFKQYLVPVEEGRKSFHPDMYQGGTVEEKTKSGLLDRLMGKSDSEEASEDETHIEEED
ncbi:MAG TPA: hypothetical protein VKP88_01660 [Candidatus Paceibacterota bacterium]|nr:hypothetical protein [Candidatus Paceibacterota bacterium]